MKNNQSTDNSISANLKLKIGTEDCEISLTVPENKTGPDSILPFARELTNKAVSIAVDDFTKDGKQISCQKGCGACCIQLVPVSDTEAREISRFIAGLSEDKRKALTEKFSSAKQKLIDANLWETLARPENISSEDFRTLGMAYFALQIPCPFLEDGACSIHATRPLSCREFLVTSPAVYCSNPNENDVVTVEIPTRISNALSDMGKSDPNYVSRWVPLIISPFWNSLHPDEYKHKTGPKWIEELLSNIK